MFASEVLEDAIQTIQSKQALGKGSMERTVAMFNAATGMKMTPAMGWLLMVCHQIARTQTQDYRPEEYTHLAAFVGLMGEEEANSPHNTSF